MTASERKTHAEVISDICATPENDASPELLARIEAIPEDRRALVYDHALIPMVQWLEWFAEQSDDYEAAFRHVANELIWVASFMERAMKKHLGEELSPARFAKQSYGIADQVLNWSEFEDYAAATFGDIFNPPPPPPEIPRDEIDRAIVEYLSAQAKPVRHTDIHGHVVDRLRVAYGRDDASFLEHVGLECSEALHRMYSKGRVRRFRMRYSLIDGAEVPTSELSGATEPAADERVERVELLVPEQTVGDGDQIVYVYFNEAERKLAQHEGRDWWPCKIGFTTSQLTSRIVAQSPRTSMSKLPIVGLVIRTDDGRALERAIHLALDGATARLSGAVGSEWFETSPRKISAWYSAYQQTVGVLKRSN